MARLSSKVEDLLRRLSEPVGVWESLWGGARSRTECLRRIGASGEWSVLDRLAHWLGAGNRTVARATAEAVVRLLDAVPPGAAEAAPLIAGYLFADDTDVAASARGAIRRAMANAAPLRIWSVQGQIRYRYWFACAESLCWQGIRPADLDRLPASPADCSAPLGLASFHHSGYVRQAALERLAQTHDGTELPYLLLALNDWVEPVRRVAHAAVLDRLHPAYAPHLVRNLPILLRLADRRRRDHQALVDDILSKLRSAPYCTHLAAGFDDPDRLTRRTLFRLACAAQGPNRTDVLERAGRHDDPMIRLWAAQLAPDALGGPHLCAFLERLLADPTMPVRRTALEALSAHCPDRAPDVQRGALLDPNPAVRWTARHLMKQRLEFDFAGIYRKALPAARGRTLLGALGGLGETGVPEDDALILPFLAHPRVPVRQTALTALAEVNAGAHLGRLVDALADPAPAVSRQAARLLRARPGRVDAGRLGTILRADTRPHVRRSILLVAGRLGWWRSLRVFLEAACASDGETAALTRRRLQALLQECHSRPYAHAPRAEREELMRILDACAGRLDPDVVRALRFVLGPPEGRG